VRALVFDPQISTVPDQAAPEPASAIFSSFEILASATASLTVADKNAPKLSPSPLMWGNQRSPWSFGPWACVPIQVSGLAVYQELEMSSRVAHAVEPVGLLACTEPAN
jgi:hypothetical protein